MRRRFPIGTTDRTQIRPIGLNLDDPNAAVVAGEKPGAGPNIVEFACPNEAAGHRRHPRLETTGCEKRKTNLK